MGIQTPAPFNYSKATSVADAIAQLASHNGEARLLAGGHSLIPMMKLRLANPEHLIDINPIEPELNYIRQEGNEIRVGAMTRHRDMKDSELLWKYFPIFFEAEEVIADPVVRNRGTLGGSLCQADPAEDLSAVCSALHAHVVIRGAGGERVLPMGEFHVGPYMTAVGDAEMLTEVRFTIKPGCGCAHEKVERRAGDWAIAAVSAALWIEGGKIVDAGLALSAVGPTTIEVVRAEAAMRGQAPSEELFASAATMASADSAPVADSRGPVDYKRHLAGALTKRALRRAASGAMGTYSPPMHGHSGHGDGHGRSHPGQH